MRGRVSHIFWRRKKTQKRKESNKKSRRKNKIVKKFACSERSEKVRPERERGSWPDIWGKHNQTPFRHFFF